MGSLDVHCLASGAGETLVMKALVREAECGMMAMSLLDIMDMVYSYLTLGGIPQKAPSKHSKRLIHLHQNPLVY
jgi:hypothetical protein